MRLRQYITEGSFVSFQEGLQMVYDNCMPYIKDLVKQGFSYYGRADDLMYSGRGDSSTIIKKSVRKDRRPKDMIDDAHDSLNREFKKQFGYEVRGESIFCTGSKPTAMAYGNNVYTIFPVSRYKVVWSPKHRDLYNDKNDLYDNELRVWHQRQSILSKDYPSETIAGDVDYPDYKKYKKLYTDSIDTISRDIVIDYQEGDVVKAIRSHKEIMLQTNKWFGFKGYDWDFVFKSYIDKYGTKYPTDENMIQWHHYYGSANGIGKANVLIKGEIPDEL